MKLRLFFNEGLLLISPRSREEATTKGCPQAAPWVTTLFLGALAGIAMLASEFLACSLSGNVLQWSFWVISFPFYVTLGLAAGSLGIVAASIGPLFRRRPRISRMDPQFSVGVTVAWLLFFQGGIILNESILAGNPATSKTSLLFDALWLAPLPLTVFAIVHAFKTVPAKSRVASLLLGFSFSSFCLASQLFLLPRPTFINFSTAAWHTITAFLIMFLALFVPFLIQFTAKGVFTLRHIRVILIPIVTAALLMGCLYFFLSNTEVVNPIKPTSSRVMMPNVILIVMETTRADHLSAYGYQQNTSPNLEILSREAIKFQNCFSTSNWTTSGHASIFTGRFPVSHGAHKADLDQITSRISCFRLRDKEDTMAEILQRSGYRTAAVVANYACVSSYYGLAQGFQYWYDSPPRRVHPILFSILNRVQNDVVQMYSKEPDYRRASNINEIAIRWIKESKTSPFFLFINYMDPHLPYVPPSPWEESVPGKIEKFTPDINGFRLGTTQFTTDEWKHISSQYDGEIAYLDYEIGNLLSFLKAEDLFDESIIIITSDHGEFLGEHGLIEHQIGLYNPVIRVPLIVKPTLGTMLSKSVRNYNVQTTDILPTVLDLLDLDVPSTAEGTSLWGEPHPPIIAQHYADGHIKRWFDGQYGESQFAVIRGVLKLIKSSDTTVELYDLAADPEEQLDLAGIRPDTVKVLSQFLHEWALKKEMNQTAPGVVPDLDDETVEKLKALGYVE